MRTHAELHVIIPSQTSGHNTNCMDGLNVNLPDIDSSEGHSEHRLNGGQLVRNAILSKSHPQQTVQWSHDVFTINTDVV